MGDGRPDILFVCDNSSGVDAVAEKLLRQGFCVWVRVDFSAGPNKYINIYIRNRLNNELATAAEIVKLLFNFVDIVVTMAGLTTSALMVDLQRIPSNTPQPQFLVLATSVRPLSSWPIYIFIAARPSCYHNLWSNTNFAGRVPYHFRKCNGGPLSMLLTFFN